MLFLLISIKINNDKGNVNNDKGNVNNDKGNVNNDKEMLIMIRK